LPIVPTDDWLLIAPTDAYDNGMGELRRSVRYRTALWFERLGGVLALLLLIFSFRYRAIAVSTPVLAVLAFILILAGCSIVLRHRAGVPVIRPSKWNAPARYRWRQFHRDVFWLPRR
jgi:hypothetical protein